MKYTTFPLIIALLISCTVSAQFSEEQIITSFDLCKIEDSVFEDFDKDGDEDILIADIDGIVYLENISPNGFNLPKTLIHQDRIQFFESGDMNNDGSLDIIMIFQDRQNGRYFVEIHYNNGNGFFTESLVVNEDLGNSGWRADFFLKDLNNDNYLDVVVRMDEVILWHKNLEGTNFSTPLEITTRPHNRGSIALIDVDQDDYIDILGISRQTNQLTWFRNIQNDSFADVAVLANFLGEGRGVNVGDLDSDGDEDIIVNYVLSDNENLVWYQNNNSFDFDQELLIGNNNFFRNIELVDIDNDNRLDVVDSGFEITWFKNETNSTFTQQPPIETRYIGDFKSPFIDIDGDNIIDFLFSSFSEISCDKLSFKKGVGNGIFEEIQPFSNLVSMSALDNFAFQKLTDIDGDGFLDVVGIISSGDLSRSLAWFRNNGSGAFTFQNTFLENEERIEELLIADFNGDNRNDLLFKGEDNSLVYAEQLEDTGQFDRKVLSFQTRFHLDTMDVDSDGDLDILASTGSFNGPQTISWLENLEGRGFLDVKEIITLENRLEATAIADFDNDGDADIVFSESGVSKIAWLENLGSGNFSAEKIISFQGQHYSIVTADFDNDGDIDIASTDFETALTAWYENLGTGFSDFKFIHSGADIFQYKLKAVDIDNDQDLDLLFQKDNPNIFTSLENTAYWFLNEGGGNFSDRLEMPVTGAVEACGDLNQDGLIDLVTANSGSNMVAWHENLIGLPTLSGTIFWDQNANGVKEENEPTLPSSSVQVSPNALSTFTDGDGFFQLFLDDDEYQVSSSNNDCWQLTTDSSSYTVNINNSVSRDLDFGYQLVDNFQHTQTRLTSAPTRCGFTVPFLLSVENNGCAPSQGLYGLVLDSLTTFVDAPIMPSEVRGDTLLWNYQSLINAETETIRMNLQIVGPEFIGSFINITGISYIQNESGQQDLVSTYDYTSEIRCAYDPNDKLVAPQRASSRSDGFDQNFTLFEEVLEYTVRFQNTGNDTAFTVVIEDQLDASLDWSSFQPIVASHTYETLIDSNGLVTFTFSNILLPDSTINEPLSHGFITYTIAPQQNLQENTVVENTAAIIFDFNPPIITNTTQNVFVSMLPTTTSIKEISPTPNIRLYPNPFQNQLIIDASNLSHKERYQLHFFDITGRLSQSFSLTTTTITTSNWQNGMYIYRLVDEDGVVVENGKVVK